MRWKVILRTSKTEQCPSKEECVILLEKYGTPEHVRRHCKMVAQVAEAIAVELNCCGLNLNIPLVISAGYLHDIARVHSKHDKVGAEYLASIGLDNVAKVVCNHTFHSIEHKVSQIDEEDVLCLADRMVLDDKYVGPEKRMEYIVSKALLKFGEEKKDVLEDGAKNFVEYVHELENFIGKQIAELI